MKKDYWYFDNDKIVHFATLNAARATMFKLIKAGKKEGGVIFGSHGSGVMISFEDTVLWTGRRAYQRPVKADGSLYSKKMVKKVRGF